MNSQMEALSDITVSSDGRTIAYIGVDEKVYYYKEIGGGWLYSYNVIPSNPVHATSSLQFRDDQNLYYVSGYASGDRNVHYFRFQEDYCNNPFIQLIERGEGNEGENIPEKGIQPGQSGRMAKNMQPSLNNVTDKVLLYPNPASGIINIKVSGVADPGRSYTIKNMLGVKIQEGQIAEEQIFIIDVSKFTSGNYIITIFAPGQGTSYNRRFTVY